MAALLRLRRDEYTVAWICALTIELSAARVLLDEQHESHERIRNDDNIYTLGRIGKHNVVLVCLPKGVPGTVFAADVAGDLKRSYPSIRFTLMVGIGGGVPSAENDVRLGDVVVSKHDGGVVQYDFEKATIDGFKLTSSLRPPPNFVLGAVSLLESKHEIGIRQTATHLAKLAAIPGFACDESAVDVLFEASYTHAGGLNCDLCDENRRVQRESRGSDEPVVHRGTIAFGNTVMKNGLQRDEMNRHLGGVLCFEMETAGLINAHECLVIRGISDYSDSHKNDKWHPYAAGTAAAYAKELLYQIPADEVLGSLPFRMAGTDRQPIQPGNTHLIETPSVPRTHFLVPFEKNKDFTGREDEMNILKRKLLGGGDCKRMAIFGLGGAGKTQIALRFAYHVKRNLEDYSVFWLSAHSLQSYEQSCAKVAKVIPGPILLDKDDVKTVVRQRLESPAAGKWLLILDGADDHKLVCGHYTSSTGQKGLLQYLPTSKRGLILITTRDRSIAQLVVGPGQSPQHDHLMHADRMKEDDATALLKKRLSREDLFEDADALEDLLTEVDRLPRAISHAAQFIETQRMSFREYVTRLRGLDKEVTSDLLYNANEERWTCHAQAKSSRSCSIVCFERLADYSPRATELLKFMAYIDPDDIPISLLLNAPSLTDTENALYESESFSLIRYGKDKEMYSVHRLVHLVMRLWLREHRLNTRRYGMIVQHVSEIFPAVEYQNRETWRLLLPHAKRLLDWDEKTNDEDLGRLYTKVGQCLNYDWRYYDTIAWLERPYQQMRNVSDSHPDRIALGAVIAQAYRRTGQRRRGYDLIISVVSKARNALAETHEARLGAEIQFAEHCLEWSRYEEAVTVMEHVVDVQRRVFADSYSVRADILSTLAHTYRILARGQQADAMLYEALQLCNCGSLGQADPVRLRILWFAAMRFSFSCGVMGCARQELDKIIKLVRDIYPDETHLGRMYHESWLASCYEGWGRLDESVEILQKVVKNYQQYPEENTDRLGAQILLAGAYHKVHKAAEAARIYEYVLNMQQKASEGDHPDRLDVQQRLALLRLEAGRKREAIDLLESTFNVHNAAPSLFLPGRLWCPRQLASAYEDVGRIREAIEVLSFTTTFQQNYDPNEGPFLEEMHEMLDRLYAEYPRYKPLNTPLETSESSEAIARRTGAELSPIHIPYSS